MSSSDILSDPHLFSEILFEKMKSLTPAIRELEFYEFLYGLADLVPAGGWNSVRLDSWEALKTRLNSRTFYDSIQVKPEVDDQIVLDPEIVRLSQMLFVGLVTGEYSQEWIGRDFYFDIRSFFFLHRTVYFTDKIRAHLGGRPYRQFEKKQKQFESQQAIGYKAFREANAEVDQLFIQSVMKIIDQRGTPILVAIAGATAAGKTEIVERLTTTLHQSTRLVTSIELDNFFTDRDQREARGIDSLGKDAIHLELLNQSLEDITSGKKINIPRYNFIDGTSSHNLDGQLKSGRIPVEINPADIIFIEGNFPFLIKELSHSIGIKVVYLTDDPIRLKRKWKRDIDYRKKYDLNYFRNRYFREQFIMAEFAYRPQMEICDMLVDTTEAALWVTPEMAEILDRG